MTRTPWEKDEIEFIRKKIFDEKKHPVLWVDEINAQFHHNRTVDSIQAKIRRFWKKNLSGLVEYPIEQIGFSQPTPRQIRTDDQRELLIRQNKILMKVYLKLKVRNQTILMKTAENNY